jgi:hypothetical protein
MLNELSVLSQPEYLWLNLIAFVVFAGFVMWALGQTRDYGDVAEKGSTPRRPAITHRRRAA